MTWLSELTTTNCGHRPRASGWMCCTVFSGRPSAGTRRISSGIRSSSACASVRMRGFWKARSGTSGIIARLGWTSGASTFGARGGGSAIRMCRRWSGFWRCLISCSSISRPRDSRAFWRSWGLRVPRFTSQGLTSSNPAGTTWMSRGNLGGRTTRSVTSRRWSWSCLGSSWLMIAESSLMRC